MTSSALFLGVGTRLRRLGLACCRAVLVVTALGWVGLRVVLPRLRLPVPGEPPPSASLADAEGSLPVERTSPEGVRYVSHNARATFELDLQRPDRHSRHLFPSFAEIGRAHV